MKYKVVWLETHCAYVDAKDKELGIDFGPNDLYLMAFEKSSGLFERENTMCDRDRVSYEEVGEVI